MSNSFLPVVKEFMELAPTSYPDVNALLSELLVGARAVLGKQFVGMMLYGSLASGDFDAASTCLLPLSMLSYSICSGVLPG